MLFLHGPSGAGKGELAKILQAQAIKQGYSFFYGSSGDFFREAVKRDVELANQVNVGIYPKDLFPIAIEIKSLYDQSSQAEKSVLLFDGVIRQMHQPGQLAEILGISLEDLKSCVHICVNAHPDDIYAQMKARSVGRVDDSEEGIRKRISNFYELLDGKILPGFAAKSLFTLGFTMNDKGEMLSTVSNCFVVNNGAHYQIGLDDFRSNATKFAQELFLLLE